MTCHPQILAKPVYRFFLPHSEEKPSPTVLQGEEITGYGGEIYGVRKPLFTPPTPSRVFLTSS
jgi:hypothetical protein